MAAVVNERDVQLQATSPRMISVALGGLLLPSLKTISLTTPINLFQVTGGSATPTSMTLTATVIGILGDVVFSVTAGTATLTSVDEDSCVLLFSDMGTTSVTIRASITEEANTYTDDLTIIQVVPGYTGPRDEITVYYTGAFVDGATTSTLFASLTGLPTKIATDRIVFQSAAGDDTRYRIALNADEWVNATQFTNGNVGVSRTLFVKDRVITGDFAASRDGFFGGDVTVGGNLTVLGTGGGGGGGGAQHLYGFFPGQTQNITGVQRIFPLLDATLVNLSAWAEVGVPYDTTVSLRINGAVVATATILAGNTTGHSGAISVAQVNTDYNTADLVSAGSSNVGFRADYS